MEINKYTVRAPNIENEEAIDTAVLEATPFDYSGSAAEVVYETEEFTFVCPWTGLSDFAELVIGYTPGHSLVELKSLKSYLTSYRNTGISQEHAVNRILHDLLELLEPLSMIVKADYKVRGGLRTRAAANTTEYLLAREVLICKGAPRFLREWEQMLRLRLRSLQELLFVGDRESS